MHAVRLGQDPVPIIEVGAVPAGLAGGVRRPGAVGDDHGGWSVGAEQIQPGDQPAGCAFGPCRHGEHVRPPSDGVGRRRLVGYERIAVEPRPDLVRTGRDQAHPFHRVGIGNVEGAAKVGGVAGWHARRRRQPRAFELRVGPISSSDGVLRSSASAGPVIQEASHSVSLNNPVSNSAGSLQPESRAASSCTRTVQRYRVRERSAVPA